MITVAPRARLETGDLALPLNAITNEAKVGIGTVYRHFPNRRVLLEELAAESYRTLIEAANAAAQAPNVTDGLRALLRDAGALRDDITPDDIRRLSSGICQAARHGTEAAADRYVEVLIRGLAPDRT